MGASSLKAKSLALTVVGRSGVDFDLLALASDTDRHHLGDL